MDGSKGTFLALCLWYEADISKFIVKPNPNPQNLEKLKPNHGLIQPIDNSAQCGDTKRQELNLALNSIFETH